MQTKKQSFKEAVTNTAIGFVISYASTFLIFPLVGFESSGGKNLIITIYFTIISILRGYVVRRCFNKAKPLNTLPWLYCFECEVETITEKGKNDNLKCADCGLTHLD